MRKKITLLFALLLAFVGVVKAGVTDLPQITTNLEKPIYYTIRNTRSSQPGGLMYYAGDAVGLKDGIDAVTGDAPLADKYQFFFTGSHDAMYIHNKATGKKLASVSSWTEAGAKWAMGISPKGGGLAIGPEGGLNGNDCINEKNYATDANTSDFTTWSANDDGSIFVVELAEDCVLPLKDMFYVIECPLFEQVQGVKKGMYEKQDGSLAWGTIDLTDKAYYWIPTKTATGLALKNAGTGKFLGGTAMSETAVDATIKLVNNSNCQFNIIVNGVTCHANNHSSGSGSGSNVVSWGGTAGSASAWTFVQKNDPTSLVEVVVTYSFTYGGEEKYTQTVSTLVGEEWPAFTVAFPYGVSASKPEGTIAAEDHTDGVVTKVIELAVAELPFVAAKDVNSISQWYHVTMHSNFPKYLEENTDGSIDWAKESIEGDNAETLVWGFVGNVFDGIKVVNKATGHAIVSTSGAAQMGDAANATAFILSKTDTGVKNGFCLKYPESNYLNASNGKVNSWGAADAGSTFQVVAYDPVVEPEMLPIVGVMVGDVAIVEGAAAVSSISTIDVVFDRPVALAEGAGWATLADSYGPTNLVAEVLEAEEGSSEYVVRFSVSQEFNGEFTAAGEYELNIPEGFIVGAEDANYINAAIEAVITIKATPLAVTNVTVGEDVMEGFTVVATTEDVIKVNFDGMFYYNGDPTIVDAEGNDALAVFEFGNDYETGTSYFFKGMKAGVYTITLAKASFMEMMSYKAPAEDIVLTVQITIPDSIDNINADAELVIYDLSGRRVTEMTKGIYIVNGKKVLVK